jgi:pimeloyl-ACP methyl ester carboxylesterase
VTVPTEMLDPQVITIDDLRIRVTLRPTPEAPPLVLLSPWPESILAYWQMWDQLAASFSLAAIDLPGFGGSEGRRELMQPTAMGDFVVRAVQALGLERPHAVGPDIGTSILLFAAARHPDAFTTIQIGGGSTAFPLQATGLLATLIDSNDDTEVRQTDSGPLVAGAARSIPDYEAPADVVDDYVTSYAGGRFADSIAFVPSYREQLEQLAALLPAIEIAVHVLAARDDPFTPLAEQQLLARALPNGSLTVLPNAHNAWEEAPDAFASAIASWALARTMAHSVAGQ